MRTQGSDALGKLKDPRSAPALTELTEHDPDGEVRGHAGESLGMIGASSAAQLLRKLETAASAPLKVWYASALARLGDRNAVKRLAEYARSKDLAVAFKAAITLAELSPPGDRKAILALKALAAHEVELNGLSPYAGALILTRLAALHDATARKALYTIGVLDRVFEIRFAAAEGLSLFNAEKASAVPMLTAALDSKDAGIVGRALAALTRLGETIRGRFRTPADMLDSSDARQRLAAVPFVRALQTAEEVPLLRWLVADADQDVRRAGVEAIEDVVTKDKDQAIKLYKPLVSNGDPVVRSKASGQLARLVLVQLAAASSPPVDDVMPKVKLAFDDTTAAAKDAKTAMTGFDALAKELAAATATPAHDNTMVAHVAELARNLDDAAAKVEIAATSAEAAAKASSEAAEASTSSDAARPIADATVLAQTARGVATAVHNKAVDADDKARKYVKDETRDAQILIAVAETAIGSGGFVEAKQKLDQAANLVRRSGARDTSLDLLYGRLYQQMAARIRDPDAKRKLLEQEVNAYGHFAKTGTGPTAQRANDRLAELANEIKQLGP